MGGVDGHIAISNAHSKGSNSDTASVKDVRVPALDGPHSGLDTFTSYDANSPGIMLSPMTDKAQYPRCSFVRDDCSTNPVHSEAAHGETRH